MKNVLGFEDFVNESLNKSQYSTLKRNDIIQHTDSGIQLRISVVKPKVSGVILNSGAFKGKPIRMGDVIAIKPTEIGEWELSSLDEASDDEFTVDGKKYPVKELVNLSLTEGVGDIIKKIRNLAITMANDNFNSAAPHLNMDKIGPNINFDGDAALNIATKTLSQQKQIDEGLRDTINKLAGKLFLGSSLGSIITGVVSLEGWTQYLEASFTKWYYTNIQNLAEPGVMKIMQDLQSANQAEGSIYGKFGMYAFFIFFTIALISLAVNKATKQGKRPARESVNEGKKYELKVAKTGKYEIRYITDDFGTNIYSIFLDGLEFGDEYDGEGGVLATDRRISIKNIEKLLKKFKNSIKESVNEATLKPGTKLRYEKDKDFTGGKITSIKSGIAEIHNWDGSTIELPINDLEYVKSWNESLNETNSKIQSNKYTMDESYAGLMPLYKKYIDLAKAGEDYEDEYYFFNRALNRAYNTEADKESVLKKLEDKFGKNPKTAGFSKNK